ELNNLSGKILDASIEVHKILGPGLLESVYEHCLAKELTNRGISVSRQVPIPVVYKGERINLGFRIDLMVEDEIIIELKAIDLFSKVHEAQIISYLKLTGKRLGLLINFNTRLLMHGFNRYVNGIDNE
ncbi:MAG: GxxExxY protein, partial [Prolixibacteraceae bacterium]|nr:GxxExxY protein [Prolixibacteraceae bacterium]